MRAHSGLPSDHEDSLTTDFSCRTLWRIDDENSRGNFPAVSPICFANWFCLFALRRICNHSSAGCGLQHGCADRIKSSQHDDRFRDGRAGGRSKSGVLRREGLGHHYGRKRGPRLREFRGHAPGQLEPKIYFSWSRRPGRLTQFVCESSRPASFSRERLCHRDYRHRAPCCQPDLGIHRAGHAGHAESCRLLLPRRSRCDARRESARQELLPRGNDPALVL